MKTGNLVGAILLVAGTAIGGGMLALPVLTAQAGMLPASLILCLSWLFMAATGTLLLEAVLWSKNESNIISIAGQTLGRPGQAVAWILYLFLFYSLTAAYIAGGGALVRDFFQALFSLKLASTAALALFAIVFATIVMSGALIVDRVNRFLVVGLFATFALFVIVGLFNLNLSHLTHYDFSALPAALLVVFTSFGYQGLVPTLVHYLKRDGAQVRLAIWIGTFIALAIYLLWEALIFCTVPLPGLIDALHCGQSAVHPLKEKLELPWLLALGQAFAFFAIVTSFFGVTLGLTDFFSDGFGIKKNISGKFKLAALVFVPPFVVVLFNPCIFIQALNIGGGLGCALLLGLLPILMIWRGRYRLHLQTQEWLKGGKVTLVILLIYFLVVALVAGWDGILRIK